VVVAEGVRDREQLLPGGELGLHGGGEAEPEPEGGTEPPSERQTVPK
jgi:hypothetical protein